MISRRRRVSALLLVAAAGAAASGCSTFESSSTVASVNGVTIDQDTLDAALGGVTGGRPAAADETGTTQALEANTDAELGRAVLGILIRATASREFLEAAGESIPAADLDAFDPTSDALPGVPIDASEAFVNSVSGDERALLAEYVLAESAWARAGGDGAEAAYNESPFGAGAVCLRIIVVDGEEALAEVESRLDSGEPFADVARELSIDTTTNESGGVLAGQDGSECLPASNITPESAGELAQIVANLGAGEHSQAIPQPDSTTFGILHARPFDEVAEAVAPLVGPALFNEFLATADVTVDSRYGRWDAERGAIVSLSS